MSEPVLSAPLSELKLAKAIHTYESIKLGLLVFVSILVIVSNIYLVQLTRDERGTLHNAKQSLLILRCAVDKRTSLDDRGKPLTPEAQRMAFDTCIRNNGPR